MGRGAKERKTGGDPSRGEGSRGTNARKKGARSTSFTSSEPAIAVKVNLTKGKGQINAGGKEETGVSEKRKKQKKKRGKEKRRGYRNSQPTLGIRRRSIDVPGKGNRRGEKKGAGGDRAMLLRCSEESTGVWMNQWFQLRWLEQ